MNTLYRALSIVLTSFFFFYANCSFIVLQHSLEQAKKDITIFLTQATEPEVSNFRRYLSYYRSVGGYQPVTPPSQELRDSLSKEAKALFEKLKEQAKPLTRARSNLVGGSALTKEGEQFYQAIIKIFDRIEQNQ